VGRVVLAAVDGSPVSRVVARIALKLAERLGLSLLVLHVVSEHIVTGAQGVVSTAPGETGGAPVIPMVDEPLNEELREVHRILEEISGGGVKVKFISLPGDPARTIVEYAEKTAAMIVMGYNGGVFIRPGSGRVLKKVLEKATVPVVVVPANLSPGALDEGSPVS